VAYGCFVRQLHETSSPRSRCQETILTGAAAGLVVLFSTLLLLGDPNYFWIDDSQSGALPVYCEMARAWRSGELPLLSRSSWRGGALGAEFPAGVFSPSLAVSSLLAFGLDLSLPLAAATISIFHLAILGAGAFRLGRQRGLSIDLALLVTLVTSLNGWIIVWGARNWGVCLFSFAWLPWFWWGLEYARKPDCHQSVLRFVPAGLFLALLISAGWPHTILMTALLSAWVMLQALLAPQSARIVARSRRLLSLWPVPAVWLIGMGLSAPAWLMFLEYLPHAMRTQGGAGLWTSLTWSVPLGSLPGLILPNTVADWQVFGNNLKPHVCIELAGGLVPVVILLACLWHGGRACLRALRWDWALCGLLLLIITSPAIGNFQYSFRWLPLFFLTLGLLSARALAWMRDEGRETRGEERERKAECKPAISCPNLGRIAFFLLVFVWLRTVLCYTVLAEVLLPVGLGLVVLALVWWKVDAYSQRGAWLRGAMPVIVVFLSCWSACVSCVPFSEVAEWQISENIRQPGTLDPAIRYLSVHSLHDIFEIDDTRPGERWSGKGAGLYLGNTAAYAGLDFVNGYSPLMPLGLQQLFNWEVHGSFHDAADARRILISETGPHGLLQLMGVDGLVVADRFDDYRGALASNGWREAARVQGGTVYHRSGPASPRVRAIEQAELIPDRFEAGKRLLTHGQQPVPSILLASIADCRSQIADLKAKHLQICNLQSAICNPARFASARVTLVEESRHSAVAEVVSPAGEGEILVVFSRPWFPGYQAVCNGEPVPVEIFDLILPAVRLPAGTNGPVVLEYRPGSFVLGCRIAATTAALVGLCLLVAVWQRFYALLSGGAARHEDATTHHSPLTTHQKWPSEVAS
jgi:hypothetical protein